MKHVYAHIVLCLGFAGSVHAQFTAGNLAVLREGDGTSGSLASTGAPIFIDQFTTSASGFVNSVTIPSTGGSALVMTGNATAEGALSLSPDGQYLTFAAYNRAAGGTGSTAASTVARVIGQVDFNQTFTSAATASSALSTLSFRSAATDGIGNYWGMGNNFGTYYFGNNSAASMVQTAQTVNRVVNLFGGKIFFSTSSAGIYTLGGTPTSGTTTPTLFLSTVGTGTGSVSPYGFSFNAGLTLAYIADDRAASAGGGIQRFHFDSGTSAWVYDYTLAVGGTVGARGVTVDFSGTSPKVFATTAETTADRLVEIVDTGSGSSAVTLDTAPANEIYRGVQFVPTPIPEPSTLALLGVGAAALAVLRRKQA